MKKKYRIRFLRLFLFFSLCMTVGGLIMFFLDGDTSLRAIISFLFFVVCSFPVPSLIFTFLLFLYYYYEITETSILGYTFWGKRVSVNWVDITDVKPITVLRTKNLRISSKTSKKPVWIPLNLKGMGDYKDEIIEKAPEGSLIWSFFSKSTFRDHRKKGKSLQWILSLLLILFVTGWFITLPKPSYMAFSGGKDSSKAILIEAHMSMVPSLMVGRIWTLYEHLHRKLPVKIWEYDVDAGTFEEKKWDITLQEISPFSYGAPLNYLPETRRFVGTTRDKDSKGSRIRVLKEGGGVEKEFHVDKRIFMMFPSPDGNNIALAFSEFGANGCYVVGGKAGTLKEIDSVSGQRCIISRWISNSEVLNFLYVAEEPNKGDGSMETGIYGTNVDTGETQIKVKDGVTNFFVNDEKDAVAFVRSQSSDNERKAEFYKYSLDDGELLQSFSISEGKITSSFLYMFKNQVAIVDLEFNDADESDLELDPENAVESVLKYSIRLMAEMYSDMFFGRYPLHNLQIELYDWNGELVESHELKNKIFYVDRIDKLSNESLVIPYASKKRGFPVEIISQLVIDAYLLNVKTGEKTTVSEIVNKIDSK